MREQLRYQPNSSTYLIGDQIRFAERHEESPNGAVTYALSSVASDTFLLSVLSAAREGATISDLTAVLADHVDDPTEAREFVLELIASQLLVPNIEPPITGTDGLDSVIATCRRCAPSEPLLPVLEDISRRLAGLDCLPPGGGLGETRTLQRRVEELTGAETSLGRQDHLDIQLRVAAVRAHVGHNVIAAVENAVSVLARIAALRPVTDTSRASSEMRRFVDAFSERFNEHEWVPLTDALDDENGLGFGGAWGSGAPHANPSTPPNVDKSADDWRATLARLVYDAVARRSQVIELRPEDLPVMAPLSSSPLSGSITACVTLIAATADAANADDFTILITACGGTSSVAPIGRFCNGDDELTRHARHQIACEDAAHPDVVFAEIVHLPKGRLANVIARPVLRDHEIQYLGVGSAARLGQIEISDLLVSVAGGRAVLWSKRLGKQVVPRLTSAHAAFQSVHLPIYRFLYLLGNAGHLTSLGWDWGTLTDLPFLPRVVAGLAVLTRARWKLGQRDLASLQEMASSEVDNWAQDIRKRLGLPRFIVLAEGDNELPVDFENAVTIRYFAQALRGKKSAAVFEMLPVPVQRCVIGPDGGYAHEMVIPMHSERHGVSYAHLRPPTPNVRRARYGPGSEWLYAKLYCGRATADRVLTEITGPCVQQIANSDGFHGWFFIRYADPQPHVRLRLSGDPAYLSSEVLPALHTLTQSWLAAGMLSRLQLDTYQPEVDRYGGPEGLAVAERFFYADSEAVLRILQGRLDRTDEESRRLMAMLGVDRLLDDFGLEVEQRADLLQRLRQSIGIQQFGSEAATAQARRAQAAHYRALRSRIERVIDGETTDSPSLLDAHNAFEIRSRRIKAVVTELSLLERSRLLRRSVGEILPTYIHMHINRLIRTEHARQEFVIYDALAQTYASRMARQRKTRVGS